MKEKIEQMTQQDLDDLYRLLGERVYQRDILVDAIEAVLANSSTCDWRLELGNALFRVKRTETWNR